MVRKCSNINIRTCCLIAVISLHIHCDIMMYNLIAPLIHLITYKKIELVFLEVNTFSMTVTKMFNFNVLFTNLLPYLYCVSSKVEKRVALNQQHMKSDT